MLSKLDITCDVKLWTELSKLDQYELCLQAQLDPVFFWENPSMGGAKLWDSQKEILTEFYQRTPEGKRKYKELLYAAGMRGGKTATAALIILTELAYMLMMDSPQKKFSLLPKEEILFLMTAATETQAIDTIFAKVIAFTEESPFLSSFDQQSDNNKTGIQYTAGRLEFPKKLVCLALGANLRANVGRTVKVFVAEEINFTGTEAYKVSPKVLYNRLSKSTTTFKPFGEDIKVAISSQADGNDFLSRRIVLTREQKLDAESGGTTLIKQKNTLELNKNLTKEMLADEFLMDEDSANQDYGYGSNRDGSSWFKKVTMDKFKLWNIPNIFLGNPEPRKKEMFIPDLNIDLLKYDINAKEYGIFSDPASVGDGFGLTVGHSTIDDRLIADGITIIKPGRDQEIDPRIIERMVEKIMNKVPIQVYRFDIYMYNELRQKIDNLGINVEQHMLNLTDWEAFKDRINTNRMNGPYLEYAYTELGDLKLVNKKVDHPYGGSKDIADSLCQLVSYFDNRDEKQKDTSHEQLTLATRV